MNLESEITALKKRNRRVELDKAWETSWTRKISIAILTYLTLALFFWSIHAAEPLVSAIVPTTGFLLSTLSLPLFKKIWMLSKK